MNVILRIEGTPEEMRSALPERTDSSSEVDVQLRLGNRPKYVGRLAHAESVRQDADRWIVTLETSGDLERPVSRAPEKHETGPREDPAIAMARACAGAICPYCGAGMPLLKPTRRETHYEHLVSGGGRSEPCRASSIHWLLRDTPPLASVSRTP